MVVFGGIGRKLDDGGGSIEDLAATVENEVVVRGDEGEGNGEGGSAPFLGKLVIVVPSPAAFPIRRAAESASRPQRCTDCIGPVPKTNCGQTVPESECFVEREQNHLC